MASNKPSAQGVVRINTTIGIDGLAAATTNLMTVPVDAKFVVTGAVVRLTAVTGSATVGVAKIKNVTQASDIIANTTLTGLTAINKQFPLSLAAAVNSVAVGGDVIGVELTTAFTVATVATLQVDLLGYYI